MRKMHKFLKILIVIIFLWAITLPWTLSYLSQLTRLPDGEIKPFSFTLTRNLWSDEDDKIIIGIVACGDKSLDQSIVLLKSIIVTSIYFGIKSIDAILFADDENLHAMDVKVEAIKNATRHIMFRYEIHPVIFPVRNHDEWRNLFKPCASQRLFLHAALPHINEILYLDVDLLVVGDLRKVWSAFKNMSTEQAVGLVPESEIASIGWYNRFAKHPYYPPYGLNTGVMLMNLTRLRQQSSLDWELAILKSFKTYKDYITFGDQDLINIVFHERPDLVYLLPCLFNFRTDHCQYGLNCNPIKHGENSVQIIHGSRSTFFNENNFKLFFKLYKRMENFNISKDTFIKDLVVPFKKETQNLSLQSNSKITPDCDAIGHLIFEYIKFPFLE